MKPNDKSNIKFYKHREIFKEYDCNVDKCVIIKGCYHTNFTTLQRQMIPEVEGDFSKYPTYESINEFLPSVKVLFRKMKNVETLETQYEDCMLDTLVSIKKKPGHRYEECFKFKNKEEATEVAHKYAKLRWRYLSDTKTGNIDRTKMFHGVYTIGARNKRDHQYEDGEAATSRAVHMPEMHVELTSSPWCDVVVDKLKEIAKGPIYIGNSLLDWYRMKTDLKNSKFCLEGDWKRFDSTLYLRIITCALAVLRCFFEPNNDKIDRHFIGMYDSLAIKDYYVPQGRVFRLFHGLPSGVKSTSLLGSIINLIVLIYCIGPEKSKNFNFIVGGDDFLVGCNSDKINEEEIIESFNANAIKLGMKLKFLKKKYWENTKIEDCPCFYKYTVFKNNPVVPPSAMLERVFMPWNKNYREDATLLQFLWDVMPSLGKPMSHLLIYYGYLSTMCFLKLAGLTCR
jgi:hypothetical protein